MENKVLKKCTCGKSLKLEDVQYIGVQEGLTKIDGKITKKQVHLFNCKHCRTTLVIKGIK